MSSPGRCSGQPHRSTRPQQFTSTTSSLPRTLQWSCLSRAAIEEIEDALVHIDDGTSARGLLRSASDHVVVAALRGLAQRGDVKPQVVAAAIERFGIIEPNA